MVFAGSQKGTAVAVNWGTAIADRDSSVAVTLVAGLGSAIGKLMAAGAQAARSVIKMK